jgi:hypothetical protein
VDDTASYNEDTPGRFTWYHVSREKLLLQSTSTTTYLQGLIKIESIAMYPSVSDDSVPSRNSLTFAGCFCVEIYTDKRSRCLYCALALPRSVVPMNHLIQLNGGYGETVTKTCQLGPVQCLVVGQLCDKMDFVTAGIKLSYDK